MGDVNLNGISATSAPGVFAQLDFAQGPASQATDVYSAIILANCSAGSIGASAAAGTVYGPQTLASLQTQQDAINLFGAGSPAMLMFSAFIAQNKSNPLFVAPVGQAGGGTAGSLAVVVTAVGGSSQSVGVLQFQVDGKPPVQVVFQATDSATTIAANLAGAINGQVNLPVTASAVTGTLTVTAKTVGARTNWLRGFANVVSGSGVSVTNGAPAFFSGGAGSDAANYTTVLNALAVSGTRYYYIIPEAGWDSVDGYANGIPEILQAQVDSLAQPAVGLRERVVMGSVDTLAHTEAVSTAVNDARLECIACKNLDLTPGELAATWVSAIMLFESPPIQATGVNFDSFGADSQSQSFWNVPAPLDGTAPSNSDIQSSVVNGVSQIKVLAGGRTCVVKRCTSRFLTSGYLDLRITDAGKVTVDDQFLDELIVQLVENFPRRLIGQEPVAGQPPPPPGVVTPSQVRNVVINLINQFSAAGVVNGSLMIQNLVVQQNVANPSSIGVLLPLYNNPLAHQFLIHGLQVS